MRGRQDASSYKRKGTIYCRTCEFWSAGPARWSSGTESAICERTGERRRGRDQYCGPGYRREGTKAAAKARANRKG